jgi:hypothetical protein
MKMTKRIISYNENFVILHDTIPDKLEVTSEDTQKLFGIDNIIDLTAFEYLKIKIPFEFGTTFQNCKSSNPLFEQYISWFNNWRRDCIYNAYNWRKNTEIFQYITNNEDVQVYLHKLQNLRFLNYEVGRDTSEVRGSDFERITAINASNYINSIGRAKLQTIPTEEGKVILKNDDLRDIGTNTNGSD